LFHQRTTTAAVDYYDIDIDIDEDLIVRFFLFSLPIQSNPMDWMRLDLVGLDSFTIK